MKATFTLLALLALTGCVSTPPPKIGGDPALKVVETATMPTPYQAEIEPGQRAYTVMPGDQLVIDVYGIAALTKYPVRVDDGGWISIPIGGPVQVGGENVSVVEGDIADALRANFVRNPQVTVNAAVTVERLYTVEGQVRTPGIYPIRKQMTLLQAIAQAQGTDEFSKLNDVVIFRTVGGQRYAGLYNLKAIRHGAYPDPQVFADDIVTVGDSKARRIFKDLLQVVPLLTTPLFVAINQ